MGEGGVSADVGPGHRPKIALTPAGSEFPRFGSLCLPSEPLWLILAACIAVMYALAQYARREMEADERTKAEKAAEEAGLAAKIAEGVEERLATIEAALQALQSSVQPREEKPPEKKVEESSSRPIKTPAEDESRKPPP